MKAKVQSYPIIIVLFTALIHSSFYAQAAGDAISLPPVSPRNDSSASSHTEKNGTQEAPIASAPDLTEEISPLDFMTDEEIRDIQKEGLQVLEQTPATAQQQREGKNFHKPTPFIMITENFEGESIHFPSTMFYDKTMEETYVITGSTITIYGPDYFPRFVIGPGRGIENPLSGIVDKNGLVYILQGNISNSQKGACLTVLNGAFFPEKELFFNDHPEMANFSPRRLAIKENGDIYIAGVTSGNGVLVLDQKLRFSHWLKTFDEKGRIVPINEVDITKDGRIFLLSENICKIFVYSPDEQLLTSFGELGGVTGKMSRPQGMALDEVEEKLFVADYMRHTILTFSFNGDFLFEIGGRGWGPGWFNFPRDVAMGQKNYLLIADSFNNRVQVMKNE